MSRDEIDTTGGQTHLHSGSNILQNRIDNVDSEFRMIPPEFEQKYRKQVNIAILDLPDFSESAVKLPHDLDSRGGMSFTVEKRTIENANSLLDLPNVASERA